MLYKKGRRLATDWWDRNYIYCYSIEIKPIDVHRNVLEKKTFSVELKHKRETVYDIVLNKFPTINNGHVINEKLENCICYFNGMRLTNLYYEGEVHVVKMSDFLTNVYAVFALLQTNIKGLFTWGRCGKIQNANIRYQASELCRIVLVRTRLLS